MYILILLLALFIGCSQQAEKDKSPDFKKIKMQLEAEKPFVKETPFHTRQFKPTLNGQWIGFAVSYGCYRKGQAPGVKGPNEEQILEDLKIISKYWRLIRIYGSDDDGERILKVISEHHLPIKVMLGLWLANEDENQATKKSNIRQTLLAIKLANAYKDIVIAVNVGNETLVFWSWHRMNTDDLIRYIRAIRQNVSVPVTTADDYNFWNKSESQRVAEEVDFIVTHMHPLWNGIHVDRAISWMDSVYNSLKTLHPQKLIVLGETGWATNYNPAKKGPGQQGSLIKGEVSFEAQEKFLTALYNWVNQNKVVTYLFEAFDEPWKGGGEQSGPNEVEKNWGVFFENRSPKPSFSGFLKKYNLNNK